MPYLPISSLIKRSASSNLSRSVSTCNMVDAMFPLKRGARSVLVIKEKNFRHNPRDRNVILFPGHENVHAGMFELLNKDISRSSLVDSHLAAFVTSHAIIERLRNEAPNEIKFCSATSGVGVGLINSLVLANCIKFDQALNFVRLRAEAIQEAARLVPSGKLRLYLKPATRTHRVCKAATEQCISEGLRADLAVCNITAFLYPGVIEVGGHQQALNYLMTEGNRLFEFKKFHLISGEPAVNTSLMNPVSELIRGLLENNQLNINEPSGCSVFSTVRGVRIREIDEIKHDLIKQVCAPLKLEQTFQCLYARDKDMPQPVTLIAWDRKLSKNLERVNLRAKMSSSVIKFESIKADQ